VDVPAIKVPGPEALWWTEINEFALSSKEYFRARDFRAVADIDRQIRQTC
jgi:hypothetical protein